MPRIVFLAAMTILALPVGLSFAQAPAQRSEAEKKALDKIRHLGGFAIELAQNDPRLDVAFHLMDKKITVDHLTPLKDLKGLVYLNLRGTEVNDDMLAN